MSKMRRSEATEQIALFAWARQWEEYEPALSLLHHIPNEGERSNGALLKAMGLKRGVPDLFLPATCGGAHGLYIEMKYGKNRTTREQEDFMERVRQEGYAAGVAYSAEEAKAMIREYLGQGGGRRREAGACFRLGVCEEAMSLDGTCRGIDGREQCKGCRYKRPDRKEPK